MLRYLPIRGKAILQAQVTLIQTGDDLITFKLKKKFEMNQQSRIQAALTLIGSNEKILTIMKRSMFDRLLAIRSYVYMDFWSYVTAYKYHAQSRCKYFLTGETWSHKLLTQTALLRFPHPHVCNKTSIRLCLWRVTFARMSRILQLECENSTKMVFLEYHGSIWNNWQTQGRITLGRKYKIQNFIYRGDVFPILSDTIAKSKVWMQINNLNNIM